MAHFCAAHRAALAALASSCAFYCAFGVPAASAYDASVGWEPVIGASGYMVRVQYGSTASPVATDVGRPPTEGDGIVRVTLTDLPLGPTATFSVSAYDAKRAAGGVSSSLSITYAQAAPISDTDDDGLSDAAEDVDLDQSRDATETDRLKADTDGDGVGDGDEITAGTNPLVAGCAGEPNGCTTNTSLWIAAARDASSRRGAMTSDATYAGGRDADSTLDALTAEQVFAASGTNALTGASGDEIRYTVNLPASGQWYLWGRLYFPGAPGSNAANSFLARMDGGTRFKLGNNRDYFRRWHWGGDGNVETGALRPLSLGQLAAGTHTLTIEKREVSPVAPRLDALVLTRDSAWRPTDAGAVAALGNRLLAPLSLAPACTDGDACDDGDPCTVGDQCFGGGCAGSPLDCSYLDGDCTTGVCDPQRADCIATTETCEPTEEIWIAAAADPTAELMGHMTSNEQYASADDADPEKDSLEAELVFARGASNEIDAQNSHRVDYEIVIPRSTQWYLWARLYYPGVSSSNHANSFFVRIDMGSALTLGDNTGFFRRWHWGGDGSVESDTPSALPLGTLTAGTHTLSIAKREVSPVAPRLDVLVLTPDASWVPTDERAIAALDAIAAQGLTTTTLSTTSTTSTSTSTTIPDF